MFRIGQNVYVKVSSGYIQCQIISKNGTFYQVKSNGTGFGCNEHRIITVEQYQDIIQNNPKQTFYRAPRIH